MRFPFIVYKRSLKATLISIASAVISLALFLTPVALIVACGKLTPVLMILFVIGTVLSIRLYIKSANYTDKLAEKQIFNGLGRECLRQ